MHRSTSRTSPLTELPARTEAQLDCLRVVVGQLHGRERRVAKDRLPLAQSGAAKVSAARAQKVSGHAADGQLHVLGRGLLQRGLRLRRRAVALSSQLGAYLPELAPVDAVGHDEDSQRAVTLGQPAHVPHERVRVDQLDAPATLRLDKERSLPVDGNKRVLTKGAKDIVGGCLVHVVDEAEEGAMPRRLLQCVAVEHARGDRDCRLLRLTQ
eukprot:5004469-Pleurochrysis_carterae.AAC.5